MLARSKEDAEEAAEAEPMPEEKPWENVSCSLLGSPQRASAPVRESMEGVGEVAISPDFCLTMPHSTPCSHACKVRAVRKGDKNKEQREADWGSVCGTKKV